MYEIAGANKIFFGGKRNEKNDPFLNYGGHHDLYACDPRFAAEEEAVIYYFVDCGDYVVDTVSEGDSFGIYNTVTDQFFGKDPGTGYEWGVVDEAIDTGRAESAPNLGVCTTWTWAYEYNEAGTDVPKEESNRYCHNMFENGVDRILTYKFEMPEDGEYYVEVGLSNPWNCASPIDMYLNGELAVSGIEVMSASTNYAYAKCSPVDGYITVDLTTLLNTINCTYILITDKLTSEETTEFVYEEYVPNTDPVEDDETTAEPIDNDTGDVTTAPGTEAPEDGGCSGSMGAAAMIVTVVSILGSALIKKH